MLVRGSGEDRGAGLLLHLRDDLGQLAFVGDGFFHQLELLWSEGHRDRLAADFAGPLVARSAALALGSVLN